MVRKFFGAAALALSMAAPVAHANSAELGPYLNLGLQHVPSDENDRLADDGWGIFAGGGAPLNKWFALEGDLFYDRFNHYSVNPDSFTWKEYGAEAAALLTIPVGNGWVPFFSAGLGVTKSTLQTSPSQESTDMAYALGAGTFYLFSAFDRDWGLRFDARYRVTAINDSPFGGNIQGFDDDIGEAVVRFGVLMNFGGEPKPPVMVDPDSDGDGVPDSRDQCPDTPKGVKVDENGCPEVVKIGDAPTGKPMVIVYFDFDKSNIKTTEAGKLDEAIAKLKAMKQGMIVIKLDGHTDSFGTEQYNVGLGERRGQAVRQYLMSHGVTAESISITSYGESKPAASNDTSAGRAQNRRVEIYVVGN